MPDWISLRWKTKAIEDMAEGEMSSITDVWITSLMENGMEGRLTGLLIISNLLHLIVFDTIPLVEMEYDEVRKRYRWVSLLDERKKQPGGWKTPVLGMKIEASKISPVKEGLREGGVITKKEMGVIVALRLKCDYTNSRTIDE